MSVLQSRMKKLICESTDLLGLNLDDLVVFTEAATGNFAVTAPIAASAGAEIVYAIARESSYGSKEDAFTATKRVAQSLDINDKILFVDNKEPELLADADIVTNTGFVRPIDEQLVTAMDGSGAIPLMYEPWEYRGDVAIEACWNANIPVVGTDESDPRIRTQEYVGLLPVQLSLKNNIEVMNSKYLILGGGDMAKYSAEKLRTLGASVICVNPEKNTNIPRHLDLSTLDAVVVVDHQTEITLLGSDGFLTINQLEHSGAGTQVFHICGPVDSELLQNSSLTIIPECPADQGHMSFTAGDLGPRPVIELHTAGLAVGEVAARHQNSGTHFQEAVDAAVSESVGKDFSTEFKQKHNHPWYR